MKHFLKAIFLGALLLSLMPLERQVFADPCSYSYSDCLKRHDLQYCYQVCRLPTNNLLNDVYDGSKEIVDSPLMQRKPSWLQRFKKPPQKPAVIAAPLVTGGVTEARIVSPVPIPIAIPSISNCPLGYVESFDSQLVNQCPKTYPVDLSEIQGLMRTDQCLYSDAVDYKEPQSVADNIRAHCRCGWDEKSLNDYIQSGSIAVRNQIFQMINDCYSNLVVSEYVAEESSYCSLPQKQVCPGTLQTIWKDSKTYICRSMYGEPIEGPPHLCIKGFFEGDCEDIYGLGCPQPQFIDAYDCVMSNHSVNCPDPQAKLQKLSNSPDVCCTVYKPTEMTHQRSPGLQ
jgi:hypothetical protein